jgi:hypothetical protein
MIRFQKKKLITQIGEDFILYDKYRKNLFSGKKI